MGTADGRSDRTDVVLARTCLLDGRNDALQSMTSYLRNEHHNWICTSEKCYLD